MLNKGILSRQNQELLLVGWIKTKFIWHIQCLFLLNKLSEDTDPIFKFTPLRLWVLEYQGVSPRTGKPVKGTLSNSVRDNMLVCDHKVVHEDFKFLGNESNRYLLKLKEGLLIKRDRPSHNKHLYSQELLLFWVFHIE